MPTIETATAREASRITSPNPAPATKRRLRRPSLLRFAWWTVPIHVALGFGFWWMMTNAPDDLGMALLWIHIGFPILLAVSIRVWWDRWGELLALLAINHAATFVVLICLPWS